MEIPSMAAASLRLSLHSMGASVRVAFAAI
jgi:hypothetical protein